MSSADWDEIKRLAADFQRAQSKTIAERLTERNCIEIVNRLIELKLLDVVFTSDGKEYVTPQHLLKEIKDELYVHGGRLSLVAVASSLNVSLGIIEARVVDLIKQDRQVHHVLGQLITSSYLDGLCEDLNEKLAQDGVISVSELSKTSDLPGDFLLDQIERKLGKGIQGKQDQEDPSLIYTETFVRRNTARLRGILSAITKPTPINHILIKFGSSVPEKLFFSIIDNLIRSKRIEGIISGSGRSAYFIPSAYSKAQIQWVEGFMNGNGYVDLDAAGRLGISDPKSFISKRFPNQELLFLKTSVLGELLFKQAQEQVEESLQNPGWIDVSSVLPVSVTQQDVQILMDKILSGVKNAIVFDAVVVNKSLLESLKSSFIPLMGEKANKDIASGKYVQLVNETRAADKKQKMADIDEDAGRGGGKKDDRRKKAAGGKAGGGTQGRETKTKSTKKKYLAGKKDDGWSDSDEDSRPPQKGNLGGSIGGGGPAAKKGPLQLEFQSVNEIRKIISKTEALNDSPQDLCDKISQFLCRGLQEEYQQVLKEAFEKFMSEKCGRKSQEEVLEKVFKMNGFLQLYVVGLSNFEGDLQNQLEKFLLKSFCQEMVVAASTFVLMEANLDENSNVGDLPEGHVKESMLALGKSTSMKGFIECLDIVLPPAKKSSQNAYSPKNILIEARETLLSELDGAETSDPALFLHIASLILFSLSTDSLLQASGKFVPQIISFLQGKLLKEEYLQLRECQEKVITLIKMKNGAGAEELRQELTSVLMPAIKTLISKKK